MVRSHVPNLFIFVLLAACASEPVGLATGNLEVDHMPPPEADSVVNQLDTIAILPIEADLMVDEILTDLTLTGQADIGSGWTSADFDRVVVNCGLFEGAVQFGSFVAPDDTGRMAFTGLNLAVAAGTIRPISVECEMDGTVEQPTGDRITVGVASDSDVAARSDSGMTPVTVGMSAMREAGALPGEDPMAATTVLPFGTFAASLADDSPAGAVRASGETVMSRFALDVGAEGALIDRMDIPVGGYGGSYASVIVRLNGVEVAREAVSPGTGNTLSLDFTAAPLVAPRDTVSVIELASELAVPSERGAGPVDEDLPFYGDPVSLGLNFHAIGEDSRAELFSGSDRPLDGGAHDVRNATLEMVFIDQPTAYVPDGENVLLSWTWRCPSGTASVKRMLVVADEMVTVAGGAYLLFGGVRLEADGVPVDGVQFRDPAGYDIVTDGLGTYDRMTYRMNIVFPDEFMVGSSEVTFRLIATLGGVDPGETARFRFDPTGTGNTGFLTPDNALDAVGSFMEEARGPYVDLGTEADPLIPSWGTGTERLNLGSIVWSDFLSGSHRAVAGIDGGSRDWIDGLGGALAYERLISN